MNATSLHPSQRFELRFETLLGDTQPCAFPCDREGHVDLDALSERTRNRYLYARAVIGRQFRRPRVQPCTT